MCVSVQISLVLAYLPAASAQYFGHAFIALLCLQMYKIKAEVRFLIMGLLVLLGLLRGGIDRYLADIGGAVSPAAMGNVCVFVRQQDTQLQVLYCIVLVMNLGFQIL